jgi:hypothetical protein
MPLNAIAKPSEHDMPSIEDTLIGSFICQPFLIRNCFVG